MKLSINSVVTEEVRESQREGENRKKVNQACFELSVQGCISEYKACRHDIRVKNIKGNDVPKTYIYTFCTSLICEDIWTCALYT